MLFRHLANCIIMNDFIKVFKAVSDKNRVRIIKMLESRELCVCEITEILDLAPSTVSKHLSILKEANLISDDKVGKWVNFKINQEIDKEYIKSIITILKDNLNDNNLIKNDKNFVVNVDRNIICNINIGVKNEK